MALVMVIGVVVGWISGVGWMRRGVGLGNDGVGVGLGDVGVGVGFGGMGVMGLVWGMVFGITNMKNGNESGVFLSFYSFDGIQIGKRLILL